MFNIATISDYFPDLSILDLRFAIHKAQMLCEGPSGANRSLTKNSYTELKTITKAQTIWLTRFPIYQPIKLLVKDTQNIVNPWIEITNFHLDIDTGAIHFSNSTNPFYRFDRNYTSKSFTRSQSSQVKITYTTGFDFLTEPFDETTKSLLQAFIEIIKITQSAQYKDNLKRFKLDQHYEVEYATDSNQTETELDNALKLFRQYRPRIYST